MIFQCIVWVFVDVFWPLWKWGKNAQHERYVTSGLFWGWKWIPHFWQIIRSCATGTCFKKFHLQRPQFWIWNLKTRSIAFDVLGSSGSVVEQKGAAIKASGCIRFSRVLYHLLGAHCMGVTMQSAIVRMVRYLLTSQNFRESHDGKLNLAAAQWKCPKRGELHP